MGTTTYGGKGSKGRMANGDWPVGAASCRQEQYTMATCQKLPKRLGWVGRMLLCSFYGHVCILPSATIIQVFHDYFK